MSLNHKVRINLACVALNKSGSGSLGFYKILVTNQGYDMPNSLIYGEKEIGDVIKGIVSKHIKVNADWLDYRLINIDRLKISESQYELNLNYLGVLPYPMDVLKGKWVDLKDIIDGEEKINESYKKTLSEAAGFIG